MPSYNEIDGVPSHANHWLLEDVLRGEWGFTGAVVSDYAGIDDLVKLHLVEPDLSSAAIRALNTGIDSDLPDGQAYRTLVDSVRAGRVPEAAIDTAVRRMLTLKFRAGLFEQPFADFAAADALTGNAEARALALAAARKVYRPAEERRRAAVDARRAPHGRGDRPERGNRAARRLFEFSATVGHAAGRREGGAGGEGGRGSCAGRVHHAKRGSLGRRSAARRPREEPAA